MDDNSALKPAPKAGTIDPDNGMVLFTDMPLFDEHSVVERGRAGEERRIDYSKDVLNSIANNQNARIRDTGDFTPLILHHTPDKGEPSKANPILGYAGDFAVMEFGANNPRPCIYARKVWVYPDKVDQVRAAPRRSVELWPDEDPHKRFFDPIALLDAI